LNAIANGRKFDLTSTQREIDYLKAIEQIYKDGDFKQNVYDYMNAMGTLSSTYQDLEAQVFYRLAQISIYGYIDIDYKRVLRVGKILELLELDYPNQYLFFLK
jgi:hypothetical protein